MSCCSGIAVVEETSARELERESEAVQVAEGLRLAYAPPQQTSTMQQVRVPVMIACYCVTVRTYRRQGRGMLRSARQTESAWKNCCNSSKAFSHIFTVNRSSIIPIVHTHRYIINAVLCVVPSSSWRYQTDTHTHTHD